MYHENVINKKVYSTIHSTFLGSHKVPEYTDFYVDINFFQGGGA